MTQSTLSSVDAEIMRSAAARVAAGPELSKDLSYDETLEVMRIILSGAADPVQCAVYFIGMRMKRETDEEFRAIMDATRAATISTKTVTDSVVAMAEPYNGFNRTYPGSLFALPILAACGVNAYSHGVKLAGPKFGVTHHTILKALGANPEKSVDQVAAQLDNNVIGWGYVDQQQFCPPLYDLTDLRTRMIKRPAMSTTESILCPIAGASSTHLLTGFVHKPYKETYAMLARHCGYTSFLLVKGTEGGVVPSFRAPAKVVRCKNTLIDSGESEVDFDLEALGMLRNYRAEDILDTMKKGNAVGMKWDIDALAAKCAEKGLAALQGTQGAVQDAAIMAAALVLWHVGESPDMGQALDIAKKAIHSGEALARLQAGLD